MHSRMGEVTKWVRVDTGCWRRRDNKWVRVTGCWKRLPVDASMPLALVQAEPVSPNKWVRVVKVHWTRSID